MNSNNIEIEGEHSTGWVNAQRLSWQCSNRGPYITTWKTPWQAYQRGLQRLVCGRDADRRDGTTVSSVCPWWRWWPSDGPTLWVMHPVWRWILDTQPSSHIDGLWRMSLSCCVWVLFNRRTCENTRDYGRRWRRMIPGATVVDQEWFLKISCDGCRSKILLKALLRLKKQIWTTNKFDLTTTSAERS